MIALIARKLLGHFTLCEFASKVTECLIFNMQYWIGILKTVALMICINFELSNVVYHLFLSEIFNFMYTKFNKVNLF